MTEAIRPSSLFPDPLMQRWVVAYGTGGGLIQDQIAPVIPVLRPDFKYGVFKADQLNQEIETRVISGEAPNQVRRAKPTFIAGSCARNALDDSLSDELISQNPNPIVLEQSRTMKLVHDLKLGVEVRIKALLDSAGSAVSAPSVKFDASSGTIDIEGTIDAAREAYVLKTGFEANVMLITPAVSTVMKRNSVIRDLRKYTDPTLLVNGDLPPILWGLKTVVPGGLINSGNPKADFSQTVNRIWTTDTIYLLYVQFGADVETMNSVAQYQWQQYGQPYAGFRWQDPHQSKRLRWISVENYQLEAVVASDSILRIPDVLT